MKYFVPFFLLLISCNREKNNNELAFSEDLSIIKDYISLPIEKKSDSISWDYFNKIYLKEAKIISINPKINELEFIYLRNKGDLIIYFKNKKFKVFHNNKDVNLEDAKILLN